MVSGRSYSRGVSHCLLTAFLVLKNSVASQQCIVLLMFLAAFVGTPGLQDNRFALPIVQQLIVTLLFLPQESVWYVSSRTEVCGGNQWQPDVLTPLSCV